MFQVKAKIAEKLNIPEDIAGGVPIVTITGNKEIYVENYRGIVEYAENCIKLQTKCSRITFSGKELEIIYYTNTDMKIMGNLESVTYS